MERVLGKAFAVGPDDMEFYRLCAGNFINRRRGKKSDGDGSFANVFLLMALAPTAIVLFLIDVYVLYKHFTKR